MAINTQKVLVGGLAAGVVMNIIDFVVNKYILGARMMAEAEAFKPGMTASMNTTSVMVSYIVMDLILGIALVWTYAAIRPRFGPGLKTATYAAFLFWILGGVFFSGYLHNGMMSTGLWMSFAGFALVNFLVSAWAGAKLYTEGAPI
jgi:hypothetical protein